MSNDTAAATSWQEYFSGAQPTTLPSARVQDNFDKDTSLGGFLSAAGTKIDQPVSDVQLLAAWALVLSTHSLLDDVVFGVSFPDSKDGRVPFRSRILQGNATTLDLIKVVESSLEQLQNLQKEKQFQDVAKAEDALKAISQFSSCIDISADASSEHAAKAQPETTSCPLTVRCVKSSSSVETSLKADTNVQTPDMCYQLLEHFQTAAVLFSSGQSIPLNEINLVGDEEFKQIQKWTATPEPVTTQPFLHKLVEDQARLSPLSVAIGQTESVMTYAELDAGANALANHLVELLKAGEGSVGNVAIFFSKSAFAVLAMFAVLKAGGAFVPIDTHSPRARIEKIIDNADITAILCSEDEKAKLQDINSAPVIPVTARSIYTLKKSSKKTTPPTSTPLHPESPAYIMHSSGSTGVPKGIAVSHLAITTCMKAMARHFRTNESTRTLQFNALTFDVSVSDIWITLAHGGRLCMPTADERFSLNEFIVAERCNFAHITPSVASLIDPAIAKKHLRMLATIGEAVKPEFLRKYSPEKEGGDEMVLIDTWGPTEASVVGTTTGPTTFNGRTLSRRAGNIGYPAGCSVFIVSAENPNFLCPAYAPGEIALVGPTLANGYWGDEAKTREAFRTDLKWTKDRRWREKLGESVMSRVYLTGDIGRFSEEGDGSIIFMYRRGGYVKVNGLRIDPGEVETAINEVGSRIKEGENGLMPHWSKNAVCVLEREVNGSDQQMLVCFIADSDGGATPGMKCEKLAMSKERRSLFREVASGLKDVVPEYMVPGLFVSVAQLPVTSSDKLDRKRLLGLLDGLEWDDVAAQHAVGSDTA